MEDGLTQRGQNRRRHSVKKWAAVREFSKKNGPNFWGSVSVLLCGMRRKWVITIGMLSLVTVGTSLAGRMGGGDEPLQFTGKGELVFPEHYREWVWLTSGLGMSYTPTAQESADPRFDNVFVSPAAYRAFVATGTWPNGTVFVLEIRSGQHKGSINQTGHYQGELLDIETHVKKADGTWAFYGFGNEHKAAHAIGHDAACYSCHEQHGAVDTTFVQFYPTLQKVAHEKGTYQEKN